MTDNKMQVAGAGIDVVCKQQTFPILLKGKIARMESEKTGRRKTGVAPNSKGSKKKNLCVW